MTMSARASLSAALGGVSEVRTASLLDEAVAMLERGGRFAVAQTGSTYTYEYRPKAGLDGRGIFEVTDRGVTQSRCHLCYFRTGDWLCPHLIGALLSEAIDEEAANGKHAELPIAAHARWIISDLKKRSKIDSWLTTLQPEAVKVSPTRSSQQSEATFTVLYRLTKFGIGEWSILPVVAKNKKNGMPGATEKPVRTWRSFEWPIGTILGKEDRELWLVMSSQTDRYTEFGGLANRHDLTEIITTAVATGRLVLDRPGGGVLRIGEERIPDLRWKMIDEIGSQKFVAGVQDLEDCDLLLGQSEHWYVHCPTQTIGKLSSVVAPHVLRQLLRAPVVERMFAADVRENIRAKLGHNIPVPVVATERRGVPVPLLRLRKGGTATSWHTRFNAAPRAELAFRYEDAIVEGDAPSSTVRSTSDPTVILSRDYQAELLYRQEVEEIEDALGFTPFEVTGASQAIRIVLMAEDAGPWIRLQTQTIPRLRRASWAVDIAHDFPYRYEAPSAINVAIDAEGEGWFDLSVGIQVGDRQISGIHLLRAVLPDRASRESFLGPEPSDAATRMVVVPIENGLFTSLPDQLVRRFVRLFTEWSDAMENAGDRVRLPRIAVGSIATLDDVKELDFKGGETIRAALAKLAANENERREGIPDPLFDRLRPYQREGVSWMAALSDAGFGGINADDMGMGKTLQSLTHILAEIRSGKAKTPSLVVTTLSATKEWDDQIKEFMPDLRMLLHVGQDRSRTAPTLADADVVVTTYMTLLKDTKLFVEMRPHVMVVDEVHTIRNAATKTAQSMFAIPASQRFALSGTPAQNRYLDLWAIFNFVNPGLLGSYTWFRIEVAQRIERTGDAEALKALQARIKPFLLRRPKSDLEDELPPLIEIEKRVVLGAAQRQLYEIVRVAMDKSVRAEIEAKGFARSQVHVLHALTQLRMLCCHPGIVKNVLGTAGCESAKLTAFLELLDELLAEDQQVVVFSFFTSFLELIKPELDKRGVAWGEITGKSTLSAREKAKARLRSGESRVTLCSLKAASDGSNMQEADSVILLDPWWNPFVEQQAISRVHRQGRKGTVTAYRLIVTGSVEERIRAIQDRKKVIGNVIEGSAIETATSLTEDDIRALLAPMGASEE